MSSVSPPRQALPLDRKTLYAEALGASRLMCGAAAWPALSASLQRKCRVAHEAMCRSAQELPLRDNGQEQVRPYQEILAIADA